MSVIQILDNADAAFRILCAYVDRSIRDHHVRRQAAPPQQTNWRAAILCFDDLASGTALAVGLPAQRAIAQRFRAMAPLRHAKLNDECRFSGVKPKSPGQGRTVAFDPTRSAPGKLA